MKRFIKKISVYIFIATVSCIGLAMILSASPAQACGWGDGGGQGFVPQRHDNRVAQAPQQALTPEQARQEIENHVKRLNPDLKVGRFNDAGPYYEAEIVTAENEVVQVIGIDKRSGNIVLIN